jgi:hypothetical protein
LKVNKTPLVHFKIPPKDRHHASAAPGFEIVMEGGALVEKKKEGNKDGKKKDDGRTNRDLQDLPLEQEWDIVDIMVEASASDEQSYSNQNVGDGFAIPEGMYCKFSPLSLASSFSIPLSFFLTNHNLMSLSFFSFSFYSKHNYKKVDIVLYVKMLLIWY